MLCVKPFFGLVKKIVPEKLEASFFFKDHVFVVDEQPYFMACSMADFFDQLPFQSLYKRLLCICKICTTERNKNTPSYLCVDVGHIRPNHLKS